ncbi:MAG: molybdate ABC transporter substrate-binding protein [Nostocoides sp.]
MIGSYRAVAGLAVAAFLGVSACSSSAEAARDTSVTSSHAAEPGTNQVEGTIVVLAAASLTEAFTTIADQFEADHRDAKVTISFGPSSGLAQSIIAGAPADVFASASVPTMTTVTEAGLADQPAIFARNVLTIAVPASNPADIAGVSDLARPGVKVAVCQAQVPCGTLAHAVFEAAGIAVTPVTEEADVKGVLTKLELGEVDAGLVYRTDAIAAGTKVSAIDLPQGPDNGTDYPIVVLRNAPNPAGAAAFAAYVTSAQGAAVLADDGFGHP